MNRKEILIVVIIIIAALLLGSIGFPGEEETTFDPEADNLDEEYEENIMETRIDQGATRLGVKVVPLEVLEDSRCPTDVQCIQAGTVRVRALLSSGLGEGEQIFELGQPITTEAELVTLVRVEPVPSTAVGVTDAVDYRFFFSVTKR